MTTPIGSATDIALNGLLQAQRQANVAAQNIAGAGLPQQGGPFGSAGFGLTGTQPGNIAGQVQQALGSSSSTDLVQNVVDLITARTSFAANIDTLKAGERITQQAIDIIS